MTAPSNSDIFIRKAATQADGERLLELIAGLASYENLTPPDEAARERFLDDGFTRRPPRFEALLGQIGENSPAGYAIYFETYSTFECRPTLYLEDFFVLPECRKSGMGTALLNAYIQEALARGCGRAEWTCLDWNVNAQRFYSRVGAAQLPEWLHYRMDEKAMRAYLEGNNLAC